MNSGRAQLTYLNLSGGYPEEARACYGFPAAPSCSRSEPYPCRRLTSLPHESRPFYDEKAK